MLTDAHTHSQQLESYLQAHMSLTFKHRQQDDITMPQIDLAHILVYNMSLCMRKPTICISENKAADQLRGDREADQRLCFRYTDSTISLLLKSEISSF